MSKRDPVCGMDVDEHGPAATSRHDGKVYYFCTTECQQRFDNDPERYVAGETPRENLPRN